MFKLIRGRLETTLSTRKGLWLRLGKDSGVSQGTTRGAATGLRESPAGEVLQIGGTTYSIAEGLLSF
jgi:hypothetical protein